MTINEFLEALTAETLARHPWEKQTSGKILADIDGQRDCPITALDLERTAKPENPWSYRFAAHRLGLSAAHARLLMNAADTRSNAPLRMRPRTCPRTAAMPRRRNTRAPAQLESYTQ